MDGPESSRPLPLHPVSLPGGRDPQEVAFLHTAGLSVVMLAWSIYVVCYLSSGIRANSDSASYIDCARSIRDGGGFQIRGYGDLSRTLWSPLRLWPPGYPLLVAGLMQIGIEPYTASLAVSVSCCAAVSVLVSSFLMSRLGAGLGCALALLTVSMRPFVEISTLCLSDGAFTLFAALSLLCGIRGSTNTRLRAGWLFAAGIAGGCAWCVRNAAVALFVGTAIYLLCHLLWLRPRDVFRAGVAWLGGWAVACGWLVYRNLTVFGQVNPYSMAPSERSLVLNMSDAWSVITSDLAGSEAVHSMVARWWLGMLAIGLCVVLWGVWREMKRTRGLGLLLNTYRHGLLLGAFVLGYVAMVIVARTVYRWGELINWRHFAPVYWILCFALAWGGLRLAELVFPRKWMAFAATFLAVCLGGALQTWNVTSKIAERQQKSPPLSAAAAITLGKAIPENMLVLSDEFAALRIFGDVHGRHMARPSYGQRELTWEAIHEAGRKRILWGVVAVNRRKFLDGHYGEALRELVSQPSRFPEFKIRNDLGPRILVLEYHPKQAHGNTSRAAK